jgi:flavin reductase (DIM6/NTAB) family NADH-FMN oxidoreductase RutF
MRRKAFTLMVPSEKHVAEADYCGMVSGRTNDKLRATGWTAVKSTLTDAPYVAEMPLVLECKVLHVNDLGLHTQFVGEILDVKAEESVLDRGHMPAMDLIRPILFTPGSSLYHGVGSKLGDAFSLGRKLK